MTAARDLCRSSRLRIPTEIMRFFIAAGTDGTTVSAFLKEQPTLELRVMEVVQICRRLEDLGLLLHVASTRAGAAIESNKYIAVDYDRIDLDYGEADFIVYGFPFIYEEFSHSVLPVLVKKKNHDNDIGTCFLLSGTVVTASHCIDEMREIIIPGVDLEKTLEQIYEPDDETLDLALLKFKDGPLLDAPSLKLGSVDLLDNILTMGFPQVPGFPDTLVAEQGLISGGVKGTLGSIVAEECSYLDHHDYLLTSARVKGGNSGGPIINESGYACGVVLQMPAREEAQLDELGYAVVIPPSIVEQFMAGCMANQGGIAVNEIAFERLEVGIRTL